MEHIGTPFDERRGWRDPLGTRLHRWPRESQGVLKFELKESRYGMAVGCTRPENGKPTAENTTGWHGRNAGAGTQGADH